MKRLLIYIPILIFLIISCEKNNDLTNQSACNIETPLEDIVWLKDLKNTFDQNMSPQINKITQYDYKDQCIFLVENCIGCADAMTIGYDYNQNVICQFGGIAGLNTCPDFDSLATNMQILYNQ